MNKDIKNKNIYILYGIKIFSNIELDFLPEYKGETYFDILHVDVSFVNIDDCFKGDINYFINNDVLSVCLGNYAQYNFMNNFSILKIICKDYEYLSATFLNLPFSLYFIYSNKGLLLHSSSVFLNNSLYAFCAPKGTGKSTLLYYMIKYTDFSFYSDDTLAIRIKNNDIYFSAASGILKLKDDIFRDSNLNIKLTMNKYSEKKIYTVLDDLKVTNLYKKKFSEFKILFLERKNDSQFDYELLKNKFIKKFFLLTNIVGTSVFEYDFQKKVCENEVFKFLEENVSFSLIKIDNDITKILEMISKIIVKIKKE